MLLKGKHENKHNFLATEADTHSGERTLRKKYWKLQADFGLQDRLKVSLWRPVGYHLESEVKQRTQICGTWASEKDVAN